MKQFIGYIRVSTVKQGEKGVSLQEQKDAITRYAERLGLHIVRWLEEMETAAKRGRPVFNELLKLLRKGQAQGVILHKLDRGARNLKDWADIAELSDQGVEIHFANESLDLHSRGGRLSADIQAVVASDFIRNLREETRKGFYGRLKQGFYPRAAPLGYLDQGGGKAKTIDPVRGPLVRKAFDLYSTGNHCLETLEAEMHRLGLRSKKGGRVRRSSLSAMLNSPFYFGLIQLRGTKETFLGIHEPLIAKALFDRVQRVLVGKFNRRSERHDFLYRRLLSCGTCSYSLIGERQKGHVYYRCHTKSCPQTTLREEVVTEELNQLLGRLRFGDDEKAYFTEKVFSLREEWTKQWESGMAAMKLQIAQSKDRRKRLTDAYLDQVIDKQHFDERNTALLMEQRAVEGNLASLGQNPQQSEKIGKFLELAGTASLSYEMAFPEEKRDLIKTVTSNRIVLGKKLELKPSIPFGVIANRFSFHCGAPERCIPRTWDRILDVLTQLSTQGLLPDLSVVAGFQKQDTKDEISKKG